MFQQLFRPLLSADFGLGSGTITDRYGNQSAETDVILYCPEIMPPNAREAVGYFPIEACIYTFEVKSVVTSVEIKDAIEKGRALEKLDNIYFTRLDPPSSRPISVLFGFSSDLKQGADREFERFKALIHDAGPDRFGLPLIRVLCVVGKGYWYWGEHEKDGQKTRGWFRSGTGGKHPEVVALIGGVLNTIRAEKQRRYGLPFGRYVIDEGPAIQQ